MAAPPLPAVASVLLLALGGGCSEPTSTLGTDPAVLAYLERALWTPARNGRVGCAYEVLAANGQTLYTWVHCSEYTDPPQDGPFAGRSGPVVLIVTPDGPVSHAAPRDGGAYAEDVERMVPARVRRRLPDSASRRHRARIGRLEAAAVARARTLGPQ